MKRNKSATFDIPLDVFNPSVINPWLGYANPETHLFHTGTPAEDFKILHLEPDNSFTKDITATSKCRLHFYRKRSKEDGLWYWSLEWISMFNDL